MKKVVKLLVTWMFAMIFCSQGVLAASQTQDDLCVQVTTTKSEYQAGETIGANLSVENMGETSVKQLEWTMDILKGYELKGTLADDKLQELRAGERSVIQVELVPTESTPSKDANADHNQSSSQNSEQNSDQNSSQDDAIDKGYQGIDTGDKSRGRFYAGLAGLAMIIVIVILIIGKKRNNKKLLSMLLCCSLVGSSISLLGIEAKASERKEITVVETIQIAGDEVQIQTNLTYDKEEVKEPEVVIPKENQVKIDFDLVLAEAAIDNADQFQTMIIEKGTLLSIPEVPISGAGEFIAWYDSETKEKLDATKPIESDTMLYAEWKIDETDTDDDGISEWLEEYIGTDPESPDTDGDGLNDLYEKEIHSDPLLQDSDQDGVLDGDADNDADGLSNAVEQAHQLDGAYSDSDGDGLDDYEELQTYKTDPNHIDTDGDGALDQWEVTEGTDPLTANGTFAIRQKSGEVSADNPVVAEVSLQLTGDQIQSLKIKKVNTTDHYLLNNSLPGYMGSGYDFTVDGEMTGAELTFTYDTALYGKISDTFQPRIYYLNEETNMLEELENQVVENGKVSVQTSHFSKYVLLNKHDFDLIWESQIKPPGTEAKDVTLDMAFVLDYSGSMSRSDPSQLFKEVSKNFVKKLRDEKDQATVIKFIEQATTVLEMTADKSQLYQAIDSITYDDGWGGTSGSAGLRKALDQFATDDSTYKYVVFITDGADTYNRYSYDDLIQEAVDSGVNIYTIGMGNAKEKLLQKIANGTGGKYYHATATESDEEILNLEEVFTQIESETIDYTVDSNGDGITDYYTTLIKEGRMPLAHDFFGIDFGESADMDNDGLLNGEEIQMSLEGERVYFNMKSNPCLAHSDADGTPDGAEVANGTDPMKYSMYDTYINPFLDDEGMFQCNLKEEFEKHPFYQAVLDLDAKIFGVWNKSEIYRDIMSEYFVEYVDEDSMNQCLLKDMVETTADICMQVIGTLTGGKKNIDLAKDLFELVDDINGVKTEAEFILVFGKVKTQMTEIIEILPDGKVNISCKVITQSNLILITGSEISKQIDGFFKKLNMITNIVDSIQLVQGVASININNAVFEANAEILRKVQIEGEDQYARKAAGQILNIIGGNYGREILTLVGDFEALFLPKIAKKFIKKVPILKGMLAIRDIFDLTFGVSEYIEGVYQIFSYEELGTAAKKLFQEHVDYHQGEFNDIQGNGDNMNKYLTHLVQLRILGEQEYYATDFRGAFKRSKEVDQKLKRQIATLIMASNGTGIWIHPDIREGN